MFVIIAHRRYSMPFVNIAVAGTPLSESQKQALFDETTRLMNEVMKKNADLTSVRIDEFGGHNWAIGRKPANDRGETAVHMDIKITEATNTDDEKAEMIRKGMEMLRNIVGVTPEASYIVIHDVKASAWGYDGLTQQQRALHKTA